MSTVEKRLQALEEHHAGDVDRITTVIINRYGETTEPGAELLAEARRLFRTTHKVQFVEHSDKGAGPWQIRS